MRSLSNLETVMQDVGFLPKKSFNTKQAEDREKQLEEAAKALESLEHPYWPALEYCGWLPESTPQERKIKKEVQSCKPYCCYNHRIGLPKIVYEDPETHQQWESDPIELYDYERKIIENYETHRYFGLNKIRGAGISEVLVVRHLSYKYAVINTIKDRKGLVMAGINKKVAVGLLYRIVQLLKPFPFTYRELPNEENPDILKFRGGGVIMALPAAINAARGMANVGDVMLDESAFWDLEDDEPVLKAMEPFVAKGKSRLAVFSTPNGQRGFFWTKVFDPEAKTKYFKQELTLEEVKNVPVPVIDIAEAERLKEEDPDLYAQEFGNKFILPSASVFGDNFEHGEHKAEF